MEVLKIFEDKFRALVKDNVKKVHLENTETSDPVVDTTENDEKQCSSEKSNSFICFHCGITLPDLKQQREHHKLDWHRYNLKQSLLKKPPISEEQFDKKTVDDDVSSISGSDSERDEESLDAYATAQGKIFLQNNEGKVFSIYGCLLYDKKEELSDEVLSQRIQACCVDNKKWTILMLGGGHFAGAIFDGHTPILHKTFHCYTVRAGQGGTQSSRDNKSGGSHPKSAGASLRRYNEQALVQHVRNVVDAWKKEMDQSGLIIYRASGPHNRSVLFGGTSPPLDKTDPRLRTIPFSTRRATFAEVTRVHSILTLAQTYESFDSAVKHFSRYKVPEQNSKRNKVRICCIDRAKSRETVERPLPVPPGSPSSEEDDLLLQLNSVDDIVEFNESLEEFHNSIPIEQRKQIQKKRKGRKSKTKKLKEREALMKKSLIDILSRGNVEKLNELLQNSLKVDGEQEEDEVESNFIDKVLDEDGNTLLHVAAMNEQNDTLLFLLNNNANPCLRNKNQQTAYTCTQSKEIRETLKEFARENPDKYNYNKAQIPTNALKPDEMAEKRKALRKIKKEKDKLKKIENGIKKQEETDKERFLKLSDREKRALVAERRILSQSGTVTARCFLCATDISGQVPFEYLGNRFCTVDCLKAHRMKNPIVLS